MCALGYKMQGTEAETSLEALIARLFTEPAVATAVGLPCSLALP